MYFFDGNKQTASNALRVYGVGASVADGYKREFFNTFSINDRGDLVSYGLLPETFHGSNTVVDSGYTGRIGWGRWTGGETVQDPLGTGMTFATPASVHYVVTGEPTPATYFVTGASLTYTFVTGTSSTAADGTIGMGIMGGTLTLNTGLTPTVDASFDVDHAGSLYSVSATAIPVNADAAAFAGGATAVSSSATCVNGCASSISANTA